MRYAKGWHLMKETTAVHSAGKPRGTDHLMDAEITG